MTPRELTAVRRLRRANEASQRVFGVSLSLEDTLIIAAVTVEEACRRATNEGDPQDQAYTRRLFPREIKEKLAEVQKARKR